MKRYIFKNQGSYCSEEILQVKHGTANMGIEINKINSDMISLENRFQMLPEGMKDVVTKSELADTFRTALFQMMMKSGSCLMQNLVVQMRYESIYKQAKSSIYVVK